MNSRTTLSLLILLTVSVTTTWGQFGSGTLLGTVSDPSGAAVPGAAVVARNTATNETRELVTDTLGAYQFNAQPAGTYELKVTAPSFKSAMVENVALRVNTQVRVDVAMQLGAVSEAIEVASTTPQLQTNTAAVGTVIDNRAILELPFSDRNFFDLIALTPGAIKVSGGSSVMDSRSAELGGVRNTSTNANLDGVDFSVLNVNNPAIALSLDAIEEFKVQMNFMDASYGHGANGIDMISKRGSNAFHGVAYDFVRNRAFQAGQFFRPPSGAPRFSYNQYGGSAGGAIKRDRTFFFANFEGRRRRTGTILQGLVPTELVKAGDFNGSGKIVRDPFNNNLPFPGATIPRVRFDSITTKMIQYFPVANITRPGVNFITTPSDKERRDQFTIRIDHRLSKKGSLFGRYTIADDVLGDAAYIIGKGLIRPDRTHHASIGYTHLASANLILETRLGLTRAYLARLGDGDLFSHNYAAELGLKNLAPRPGNYTLPNIGLTGYAPGAPASPGFVGYGSESLQYNMYYRAGETLTYVKGRHSLKVGGDLSRLMVGFNQGSNQNGVFNFSGNFAGDSFADYLLGTPQNASGGLGSVGNFGGVAKYSIASQLQAYVQDDWRITDRFTLNLGVRYEMFLQWRGRHADFDLGTLRQRLSISPDYYVPGVGLVKGTGEPLIPERTVNTDYNDWAPRLGMAYRLGSKSTIRSGFGMFYALNNGGETLEPLRNTVPYFVVASLVSGNARPELFMADMFPTPDKVPGAVTRNVDLNRRTGYIYQYNLTVQHQLRNNLLVEAGYMGNTGHKQSGTILVNQPRLPSGPTDTSSFAARSPYPTLTPGFTQAANYQWSNYNAAYLKVEQRATKDLSYSVSYTFAKSIDSGATGQNVYDRQPERGLAGNDVRHNVVLGYVYELPFGKGKRFNIANTALNAVAGGWQVNGVTNFRSGMPITIVTTGDIANVSTGGQRGNATGVTPSKLDPRINGLGLDRTAYSTPARFTYGNLSRNTQPGFGANNWDFSAIKNFAVPALGEASKLQLRFEFFNFFNHTQFNNPGATVNQPTTFGFVTSARDPRILQIAGKLYW